MFTESRQLIVALGLDHQREFTDITPFETGIGFSAQRPYPPSSAFKPPVKKDGSPDTVVLLKVGYRPQRADPTSPTRIPMSATASVFSRYISKHFDYNFEDADCPTQESVRDSRKSIRPIDLEAIDQFIYDHASNTVLNSDGKTVDGVSIIRELYEKHVATVDSFSAKLFRLKLASVGKVSSASLPLDTLLKWSLRVLCGRTIELPKDTFRGVLTPYSKEDMKLLVTESIDVFGYRASKNVIGTFCVLMLLAYVALKVLAHVPTWLVVIANNTFLGSAACILLIGLLDHALPNVLLRLINVNIAARVWFIGRRVRFR